MIVGRNWRKRWEFKLMLKCHCANSSEIGTSIINDVGRQAAQKKQQKYTFFWSNLIKQHFILMIWRYILTFNAKMIFQKKKSPKSTTLYIITCDHVFDIDFGIMQRCLLLRIFRIYHGFEMQNMDYGFVRESTVSVAFQNYNFPHLIFHEALEYLYIWVNA